MPFNNPSDYINAFTNLRSDASRTRWSELTKHRAPHKPLLLLAVIDMFGQESIRSNLIELTPDLGETFTLYWSRVMPPDQRANIALPFFHLQSDGFWHLVPRPGKEAILAATQKTASVTYLRELALGAKLDDGLFSLLRDEESRNVLRAVLIETYFAPELQRGLYEQSTINAEAFVYSEELLERVRQHRQASASDELKPTVRDQGFRRAVVAAYDHHCAMCGIRMLTADGHTVVDAAHIIPWSISHKDDPRNGMALCRLCHWSFDEGMLGVSARYVVIASPQVTVGRNVPQHVPSLAGLNIVTPVDPLFSPDLDALKWHRQNIFRNR